MKTRRRTEIIFERERTILYADRYLRQKRWCSQCGAEVEMVTVFEAARLIGVSSHTIYSQLQRGELHTWATGSGLVLVCVGSLEA
jgi:excisionase family DNA binding protein